LTTGAPTFLRIEFLRTVAETTGGRAIVNNNDMEQLVPAALTESSSYYLLGIESAVTKDDGRFHPIRVRVGRPGLEARTRNGYYSRTEKERKAMAAPLRGLDASIAGALPKSDFPMNVTVVDFVRVYQGGSREPAPATITTRVIDSTNKQLGDGFRNVEATSFGKSRSFDYRFDLPVRDLSRGEYLLTVDVAAGSRTAQRALRFRVD
jgi:hypothetical protein